MLENKFQVRVLYILNLVIVKLSRGRVFF